MSDLVNKLRESRKSYAVLLQQIIAFRSSDKHTNIFIFEGGDDIGVYECWIKRCSNKLTYVPMAGNGKEQLITFHSFLESKNPELLNGVYLFVDRDFDKHTESKKNIFVLEAYSIENILSCQECLESLLYDEMEQTVELIKDSKVIENFNTALTQFETVSRELNFHLFLLSRLGVDVKRKPEKATNYCDISLSTVTKCYSKIEDILEFDGVIDATQIIELEKDYNQLTRLQLLRGKYVLSFFRKWVELLTLDLKSNDPKLFKKPKPNIKGEPWSFKLRRLASCSPLPIDLPDFIRNLELTAS